MNIPRKCSRLALLKKYERPDAVVKIEVWPTSILVSGLLPDEKDYLVFDTLSELNRFLDNNFSL